MYVPTTYRVRLGIAAVELGAFRVTGPCLQWSVSSFVSSLIELRTDLSSHWGLPEHRRARLAPHQVRWHDDDIRRRADACDIVAVDIPDGPAGRLVTRSTCFAHTMPGPTAVAGLSPLAWRWSWATPTRLRSTGEGWDDVSITPPDDIPLGARHIQRGRFR